MRKIKYKKGRKEQPTVLEYTGIHKNVVTEMQMFVYDVEFLEEIKIETPLDLERSVQANKTNWLNVHGLNDIHTVKEIGKLFDVDHFMMGDILNTTKRTKLDEYHDVLFFSIKSLLPVVEKPLKSIF